MNFELALSIAGGIVLAVVALIVLFYVVVFVVALAGLIHGLCADGFAGLRDLIRRRRRWRDHRRFGGGKHL